MSNSATHLTQSSTNPQAGLVDHYTKMGKMTQLARLLGLRNLKMHHGHQRKNLETQAKVYQQALLKNKGGDVSDEDMGDETIIMGDYHAPPAKDQSSSSTLGTLATLALGGLLGGGGIVAGAAAMYLLNKSPDVIQPAQPQLGEEINIGLGKLEDYLKAAE